MPASLLAYRRVMIAALHAVLIIFAYYASFLLRLEYPFPPGTRQIIFQTIGVVLAIKLLAFARFGQFSGWWRYAGLSDFLDITKASVTSSFLIAVTVSYIIRPEWFPRSVYLIDLVLTILLQSGVRLVVRLYTESVQSYTVRKNTLIAGAGRAGTEISRQLRQNPDLGFRPIGFVDDNPSKKGIRIHGLPVLGNMDRIPEMIQKYEVKCVLIAMPSANGRAVERIVHRCREAKVEFRIVQPVGTRINGHAPSDPISRFRELQLEDLLRREPVRLETDRISERIRSKVVLITGAGGSIGSELCRQVARFGPQKLVLFERSENDLFKLCTEFTRDYPSLNCVPVVGDIQDVSILRNTFAMHRPNSVFHAAAYKHVPMMEMNCFQAITNNVFGTWNMAQVARQYQTEDFVLISTDKAVNPTNIMGVSKRIAEMIVLGVPPRDTRFLVVRFGNVLGSNGSVVPLFQDQIAKGGPVLVTHPEAKRYFMTIPEATQLVLQAASMNKGGEILLLKMGEQVRIADLAADLVRLAGLEPVRDIKIIYTGLRPGEKISEELTFQKEGVKPTPHEKLCVVDPGFVDYTKVRLWMDELASAVEAKNVYALVSTLRRIVPEYQPSPELLTLCEVDQLDLSLRFRDPNAWRNSLEAA